MEKGTTGAPASGAARVMDPRPSDSVVKRVNADMSASGSTGRAEPPSPPPPRKRPRLSAADEAALEKLSGPRRRILEHKLVRLKHLKERYVEHGTELFFLQAGGNILDYAAWRKRPPAPQLLAFLQARPLHPADDADELVRLLSSAPAPPPQPAPEVKLSGAGATPVAVSTTLPAAVAQLTTQGWQTGRPAGGRHGMVFAPLPRPSPSTAPKFPGGTPLILDNASAEKVNPALLNNSTPGAGANTQEQIVEKAKQEAYVVRRATELQREGLWAEKRLPRVMEPPRVKAHWDYLLEEMVWLAADFAQERKWKKAAAKKCARMVQKHFQDKASAAQRAEKAQELQLRRIAAFAAKEIRTFWSNVEKLVEFKRSSRLEERRKKELDRQLSFIVDQTERYSKQLAAGITGAARRASRTSRAPASDDEFRPGGSSGSEDDEETIEAAEREAAATRDDTRAEVEALKRESHLDLDQIMKALPPGYLEGRPPPSPPSSADYSADEDSADDEDTIMEQERREDPRDTSREVDALKAEGEMSIEELMKRYVGAPSPPTTPTTRSTRSSSRSESDAESGSGSETGSESLGALVEPAGEGLSEGAEEERVQRAAELAAALQPTGNTLSETAVATPVPHLLRHSLREYQHVGLHWLATMRARRLNGILADEMGLGKTIQTIALLAHEALERSDWGPHLVVVPTSVMLNWEMEFKKWCPAFKILTYYGTIKERKLKRVGWTKPNAFHVCITSYKLVIQDHQSFRRKRWKYLILDEAQNIKNFKSQRWQLLLNFQTEQRLLLTGTPLQNNLMELWSLMHFLMPDVFASHTEFKEWFSPVAGMIDGTASFNQHIIQRLHKVLRPFLLRRLKSEVEKQMPKKYEHVLMCRLSKRQRFLYDDFMSRAKTRESLASGNLLSVINVLMQLRKVCNHPNLFETRPVVSPLQMEALRRRLPAALLLEPDAAPAAVAAALTGCLALLEVQAVGAFVSHRARHLAPPRRLVEELSAEPAPHAPAPPAAAVRLHLRLVPRPAPPSNPPHAQHLLRRVPPASSHHHHQHQHHHQPPQPAAPAAASATTQHNTEFPQTSLEARLACRRRDNLRRLALNNERRCWRLPLYGADLRAAVRVRAPTLLAHSAPTVRERLRDMHQLIDRFTVYISGAVGPGPQLETGCGCGARAARAERADAALAAALRPALRLLHPVASRLATAFPHPRLIQYDCGKLQTLDALLRRLKCGGHRVLVFTQMTKMLDVLEAFLNYHGHTYLRLDGATRVDARQMLVDRFNADRRVFAFILSTRSGGVGLNLTGADTVVFYDSDWNPTMDAQAQDRCHRIGQTRDVHVYRLVCERTVEENILRKAGQKRALGDVAIESGNFTTNYLRTVSIQELLGPTAAAGSSAAEGAAAEAAPAEVESALAACEDEADAAAARTAGAEAAAELAEFDENIPLEEEPAAAPPSAAAQQHNAEILQLEQQLTPIEKYAMRVVESSDAASEAERAAAEEMERQLREWESARRAIRDAEPPPSPPPAPPRAASPPSDDDDITFSRADAHNHVWISDNTMERMPMWCPPTPPQGENDVYMDVCADSLYHRSAMTEAQLPGVNVRRSPRPPRSPRPARRVTHPHTPHHAHHAPRSLFERPAQLPRARPRVRAFPQHDGDRAPDWTPAEDSSLAGAVRAQGLAADFSLAAPALLPNWDFAADVVAESARAYRSPRQCRDRYETAPPRDDAERRKQKKGRRTPPLHRAGRARGADEDATVPRLTFARFDAMRLALERKTAAPKRRYDDPTTKNPRHAAALAEYGVDYEAALAPMEVATRRAERIAKEKSKTAGASGAAAPGPAPAAASPAPRAAPAAPAPAAAPAVLPPAPAPTQPQRIVVAAHPVSTVVAKGVSGAVAGVSGVSPAQLQLFRHQAFARQQLKILQQQQSPVQSGSGGAVTVAGRTAAEADAHAALLKRQAAQKAAAAAAAAAGGAAPAVKMACASQIRQLQLQQQLLAQRKAAAAAGAAGGAVRGARVLARPPAPQQVVVAHLTPHPHPGPAPPADHPHQQ